MRRVLLKMAVEAEFFGDSVPSKLEKPFILRYLSSASQISSVTLVGNKSNWLNGSKTTQKAF